MASASKWCCIITAFVSLLGAAPAYASVCLSGPSATGIVTGPDTVSATAKNSNPQIVSSSEVCAPQSLFTGATNQGSGASASFTANNFGIAAVTSATSGGAPAGKATATASPQLAVTFRVDALPQYSGTPSASVRIEALLTVAGNGNVSGAGPGVGGEFQTTVGFGAVNAALAIFNRTANGNLLTATTRTIAEEVAIDLDRDYKLSFVHHQSITAGNGQSADGVFGSATAVGKTQLTYQVTLPDLDPSLSLTFPMVDALSLDPPALDAVIALPGVPLPGSFQLMFSILCLVPAFRVRFPGTGAVRRK